jgi:hypothetical protein
MVWPTSSANLSNVNSATDSPSLARQDIYDAFSLLNGIIASQNTAYGAVVTNGFNKIDAEQLPNNISTSGNLSLEPGAKWVTINNILNLAPQTTAQIAAMEAIPQLGDMMLCSDGDAGAPCIIFHDGTDWKKLPFSGLSVL